MKKIIKYFLEAFFVYLFFFIGKLIGINLSRKIFSTIFVFFGPLFRSRKIIQSNLINFKKNISKKEINYISSNMWKNYGMTFIEYIFLDKLKAEKSNIKVIGEENLNIKDKKQFIFVSGHFANFEMMSMEIIRRNIKLATIYRPLNNFFINPLMEYLRKKYICKNQIKKGKKGVRKIIDLINEGFSIALMIDQRVSEGEMVNFFNVPARTTTLPSQLAIKFNLHIVPVFIERDNKNSFIIKFKKPIDPSDFKDKISLTKKLNEMLEDMIIENPNHWIWTHNRWK
jgi:Kdo2-lipid IVA lauroyltransferase/acyltransferase